MFIVKKKSLSIMNENVYKILNGINLGDQIGGPFDLASVLINAIKKNLILINHILPRCI